MNLSYALRNQITRYANPGNWADHAACKQHVDDMVVRINPKTRVARHDQPGLYWCDQCPVLSQCRQWALTEPDPAYQLVAGGMTPHERKTARLRRRHGA
jgi:hypothetical protein